MSKEEQPEDDKCGICLETMKDKEACGLSICSHRFHSVCFHEWYRCRNNKTCPLCRKKGKTLCSEKKDGLIPKTCKILDFQYHMKRKLSTPMKKKGKNKKKINISRDLDHMLMFLEDPKTLFKEF